MFTVQTKLGFKICMKLKLHAFYSIAQNIKEANFFADFADGSSIAKIVLNKIC